MYRHLIINHETGEVTPKEDSPREYCFADAIKLAQQLEAEVSFTRLGVEVRVQPGSTVLDVMTKYDGDFDAKYNIFDGVGAMPHHGRFHPRANRTVDECIKGATQLAASLGRVVEFPFNEVTLRVAADSDASLLMRDYLRALSGYIPSEVGP